MKKWICKRNSLLNAIVALLLLIVMAAPALAEEEEKPTADFSVTALSAYIWRGQELTKNSVVIQPSMTVGYKGFTANLWGNLDTKPYSTGNAQNSSNWTETDLTLSYNKTFGPVTAGVGYIYYGTQPPAPVSQEVFVTATLNKLLSPTLTIYREVDHYQQWYFLLGLSHAIEFNKTVSLKLAASASYLLSTYANPTDPVNTGYPKFNSTGAPTTEKYSNFHDGVVTASLPINVVKYISVSPTVSYVFPLCDDATNEMKARSKSLQDSSFLYGGLTLDFSF